MDYKVIYHIGETIDIGTKVVAGRLWVDQEGLRLIGDADLMIPRKSFRSAELFRLHGSGRMIKIKYSEGTVYVSVIRFNLFGYFAVGNFFATGELLKKLETLVA